MPVQYITYQGKEILHIDVSHQKNKKEVLKSLEEVRKAYEQSAGNLLVLADVTGVFTDPEIIERFKHYGKTIFAKKAKKRAIVGVSGLKKIVITAYNKLTGNDLRAFDDIEKAKIYLVS